VTAGNLSVEPAPLPGLKVVRLRAFRDARGAFVETWREDAFRAAGIPGPFVQDNHSRSARGVLRGLHWQDPPSAQGKLVRCTRGAVWDVAVDLHAGSPTLGRHHGLRLAADDADPLLLWIPEGFAHGFLALEEDSEVQYRCTAYWDSRAERTLRWDDPDLAIAWPRQGLEVRVSDKDAKGGSFREYRAKPSFGSGGAA
jgi:dTDP-4-dehydrorhamnose 3,5-epimerase